MSSPSKRSSREDFSSSSSKRAATARLMGRDEEGDSRVGGAASRSTRDYIDCLDSILHPNSDANASEQLLVTLQELQQMDTNLQSMKGKLREMRVSAAQELLEQALLYQPTLREALADAQTELAATAAAISASVSAAFSELEATDLALAALGEAPPDAPSSSGGEKGGDAASTSSTSSDPEAVATGTEASAMNVSSEQFIELETTKCCGFNLISESPLIVGDSSTYELLTNSAVSHHPAKPVMYCVGSNVTPEKNFVSAAPTSCGAEPSTTGVENFNITREISCAAEVVSPFSSTLKVPKSDHLEASQPSYRDGVSVQPSGAGTISCTPSTSSSKEQSIRVEPLKVCSSGSLINETVAVHECVCSVTCDVPSADVVGSASPMHKEQGVGLSSQNQFEFTNDNVSKQSQIHIIHTQETYLPIEPMEVDDNVIQQSRSDADFSDCQTYNASHRKNHEGQEIQHHSDFRDSLNAKQEGPNQFPFLSDEISNNSEGAKSPAFETAMESVSDSEMVSSTALVDALDMEVVPEFLSPVLAECNSGLTMLPVQRILPAEIPNDQPAELLSENCSTEFNMNEKPCSSAGQNAGTLPENERFPPNATPRSNETYQLNAHATLQETVSSREDKAVLQRGVEYSVTSSTVDQQSTTEYETPQLEHLQQQANINTEQLGEQRASNEIASNEQPPFLVSVQESEDTLTDESASPRKPFHYKRDPTHVVMNDSLTPAVLVADTNEGQVTQTVGKFPQFVGTSGSSEVYKSTAGHCFAGVAGTTSTKHHISVIVNEGIECNAENEVQHTMSMKTSVQDQVENVGQPWMSVQQEVDSLAQLQSNQFQQQEVVLNDQETCVQPRSTLLSSQVDPAPEETVSAQQEPTVDAMSMAGNCSHTEPDVLEKSETSSTKPSDGNLPSNQPLSRSGGQSLQCSSFLSNLSVVTPELKCIQMPHDAIRQTLLTSPLPAPTVQEKPSVAQSQNLPETLTSDRQQDSMSPAMTQQLLALLQTLANTSSVTSTAGPSSLIPSVMNPELAQAFIVQMQGALAVHQGLVEAPVTTDNSQTDELPLQHQASENDDTENK